MSIFHRHAWVSVAVQPLLDAKFDRSGKQIGPDAPITEVLQRCACQALRTVTLDGSWTFEQVTPPTLSDEV